jgi:hypothetical protein
MRSFNVQGNPENAVPQGMRIVKHMSNAQGWIEYE